MSDYQARVSGPLMDRIDIRIDVPAVSASDLIRPMLCRKAPTSPWPWRERARVSRSALPRQACNRCAMSQKMEFSARGYHGVLKVAGPLADLDDKQTVGRINLAEAISYYIAGERLNAAA